MATTLYHWKNGAAFEGTGTRFSDVTDPATGEVSAQLALASAEDVEAVVAAAQAAFPGWRDTSLASASDASASWALTSPVAGSVTSEKRPPEPSKGAPFFQ